MWYILCVYCAYGVCVCYQSRCAGRCFVKLVSVKAASEARNKLDKKYIGSRYIDVFQVSYIQLVCFVYTVEPLNNVTFGTSYSVHYREVSFLRRL